MRKFTVRPRIQNFELNMLDEVFGKAIPSIVRDYLKKYAGLGIFESTFVDKNGLEWELNQFNLFDDIYGLSKEFIDKNWGKMLPFGYDPGGWHFCLCMDDINEGKIYINRWTDHLPEDQFLKIADSFEEFINGLHSTT